MDGLTFYYRAPWIRGPRTVDHDGPVWNSPLPIVRKSTYVKDLAFYVRRFTNDGEWEFPPLLENGLGNSKDSLGIPGIQGTGT